MGLPSLIGKRMWLSSRNDGRDSSFLSHLESFCFLHLSKRIMLHSVCPSKQLICWMKGDKSSHGEESVCFSIDIRESQKWKDKYKERRIFVTRIKRISVESNQAHMLVRITRSLRHHSLCVLQGDHVSFVALRQQLLKDCVELCRGLPQIAQIDEYDLVLQKEEDQLELVVGHQDDQIQIIFGDKQNTERPPIDVMLEILEQKEEIIDSDLCPTQCRAEQRIVGILNLYHSLNKENSDIKAAQNKFIEFCDVHYGADMMLEDYLHCRQRHKDMASLQKMGASLDFKCSGGINHCSSTTRHYRNRSKDNAVHFYIDILDTMHFNILHLTDVGLRVPRDVDKSVKSQFGSNDGKLDRLNPTKNNSKYTMDTVTTVMGADGGHTIFDEVLTSICKKMSVIDDSIGKFQRFLAEQQYDTDAMHSDLIVFRQENDSNLGRAINSERDLIHAMHSVLRYFSVCGTSFSTGIWFTYWDYYQTDQANKEMMSGWQWKEIDFGGHSVQSLYVEKRYGNIKEEALATPFFGMRTWIQVIAEKAQRFIKSTLCKKMTAFRGVMGRANNLHFEIPKGSAITKCHLHGLFLYTDSTQFCAALSETFRPKNVTESIEEINTRNSHFYWTSRRLRELVHCFGEKGHRAPHPFYSGISREMYIPQFQLGLIGPTSTSAVKQVARNFAGERGMLIVLDHTVCESNYFDASPFSTYTEEDERLFFGSQYRTALKEIIKVRPRRKYQCAVTAYAKFDAIFSGRKAREMTDSEIEIIRESLKWLENGHIVPEHEELDLFILNTFYSFTVHKKLVRLDFNELYFVKNKEIINLVVHPIGRGVCVDPQRNLVRPFVFELFQHVQQINIQASDFVFDLKSFLKLLKASELPESLEQIVVEGIWVEEAYRKLQMNKVQGKFEMKLMGKYPGFKQFCIFVIIQ